MSDDGLPLDRVPIGKLALLLVLLGVVWLVRPWLHGVILFVYVYPAVLQALVVVLVGAYLFVRVGGIGPLQLLRRLANDEGGEVLAETTRRSGGRNLLIVFATLVLAVAPLVLGGAYSQVHVANTLDVDEVDSLPEIDADRPRILPRSVAKQYASNSLQFPRYRIAAGDITVRNGSPTWSFGLAPDGGVNELLLVGHGGVFVDMTTSSKRVDVVQFDQQVGFGLGLGSGRGIVSTYRWHLLKGEYLVRYTDPIMIDRGGDIYMAVPYISYEHHARLLPVPSVYTTPQWGGVALVSPDGSTEHLSPAEARSHPVLEGQRLFPFELARYYVESMRYKRGILNKWFVHEDELEVAPLPGEGNDQPFFAMTREGIQYFVAAEPYGDAQGIYQMWTFDGRTGQAERFQLPVDSALMGPRRAADFVRKANPQSDWDRFSPSEPVPAVVNGTLFWQVRVVPSDSSGIAYTAFVNAESGDVFTVETDEGIRAFLAGTRDVPDGGGDGGDVTGERAIVVSIRDANGTVVDRITVAPGGSVEISYRNATSGANRSTG